MWWPWPQSSPAGQVKWMEPHRDFVATGPHQRDVFWDGKIAFKNDGTLLGLKAKVYP
ncbi:MAG: hypothetical protein U5K27_09030 [Desulfotignum sp.]|nr:hypothetical protein [Desulfotignum sp.]